MRGPAFIAAAAALLMPCPASAQLLASVTPARIHEPGRLTGDAEAVIRVEKMIARMGGAQIWSRAKTLYLKYDVHLAVDPGPRSGTTTQWINLERPGDRVIYELTDGNGTPTTISRGYSATSGWRIRDGQRTATDKDALAARGSYWSRDFYTTFHRFAAADPNLRLSFAGPNNVGVVEATGTPVAEWVIDKDGNLLAWKSTSINAVSFSYVIGPLQRYGAVSFGGWNASADGISRYSVIEFGLSAEPMPPSVYTDPATTPVKPKLM